MVNTLLRNYLLINESIAFELDGDFWRHVVDEHCGEVLRYKQHPLEGEEDPAHKKTHNLVSFFTRKKVAKYNSILLLTRREW